MNRKQLLEMLPYWVDAMREAGEERISTCLDAIQHSIKKEDGGDSTYMEEIFGFANEVLHDFPLCKQHRVSSEKLAEKMLKDLMRKREELLQKVNYLFEATPTPADPRKFC